MNNCIGGQNYRLFASLIGVLTVSQAVFCAFAGAFLGETAKDGFVGRCREYSGWDSSMLVEVMVAFALLAAGLTAFGISNLIGLHLWLRKVKHMTTYDYIISQRKSAKYKENVPPTQRNDDSDRSDHSYQLPLVSKTMIRGSTRIVPELTVGVLGGDRQMGVVSPVTDLSGVEKRREDGSENVEQS